MYIGTFDQRSAQRPPQSCLTSPCCGDFILFRIFAAQILVPLCVSLTRRHFGAFFGGQEISAYIYNLTFLAFFFFNFLGAQKCPLLQQRSYSPLSGCRQKGARERSTSHGTIAFAFVTHAKCARLTPPTRSTRFPRPDGVPSREGLCGVSRA